MAVIFKPTVEQNIRQYLKRKRAEISKFRRHIANIKANTQIYKHLSKRRHIASYLAFGNELSTSQLNHQLLKNHRCIYVPITLDNYQMAFLPWRPFCSLFKNEYGIEQPRNTRVRQISPRRLEAMIIPLLGFDRNGHRIGMGGGFYDRYLTQLKVNTYRVGIAYASQELRKIKPAPWDQSLNAVITEGRFIKNRLKKI